MQRLMMKKTPLFYAVHRNFGEVVKLLLQHKASGSHLDKAGNCILHFVKDMDICGNCIKAGAKLATLNKQGNFPLHAAYAFLGNDNLVTKYIANVMDKELVSIKNKNGYTPAECAALSDSEKKIVLPCTNDDESLPECGGLFIGGPAKALSMKDKVDMAKPNMDKGIKSIQKGTSKILGDLKDRATTGLQKINEEVKKANKK